MMNEHLKAAIDFSQIGADHLDNGRFERGMEYLLLAETAAAIAQAEVAERQAVAMERLAAVWESVISPIGGSPSISTFDAYQTWKESL